MHAESIQDRLHLVGVQCTRPIINGALQQGTSITGIGRQISGERRGFPQLFLVTSVLHHVHKGGDGAFRCAVCR